jgi:16S rRNA (guanine(527)-N(7))-methyltransferase GidB
MQEKEFVEELSLLGINITADQLKKLNDFYKLLVEWNEKINLTAIVEEQEVYLKHFYDSLTLIKAIDLTKDLSLCDVGSGAGFPGIVLKIVFPNLNITLIDSLNKRVIYLNDIIEQLELSSIKAIHARMEDYARDNQEKFDIITARAVTSTQILSEICVKALKIGGYLILMKGNCEEELESSSKCFKQLNLELSDIHKFILPIENSNRTLVVIEKIGKTDKAYPRSIDKIKKSPL